MFLAINDVPAFPGIQNIFLTSFDSEIFLYRMLSSATTNNSNIHNLKYIV